MKGKKMDLYDVCRQRGGQCLDLQFMLWWLQVGVARASLSNTASVHLDLSSPGSAYCLSPPPLIAALPSLFMPYYQTWNGVCKGFFHFP